MGQIPRAVQLFPQGGAPADPVLALSQIIRHQSGLLRFENYEQVIQGAGFGVPATWNGIAAYDALLQNTQAFVDANSQFNLTLPNPAQQQQQRPYNFTPNDLADVQRRIRPSGATQADLDAGARALDDALPGAQAQFIPGDQGVLRAEQQRANQQITNGNQVFAAAAGVLDGIDDSRLRGFRCVELIWSYWMEQAMLVQGMNVVTLRYQNRLAPGAAGALARCDISNLRPLANLLWGYIQNENDRLSVQRRAYEYDHHYGLRLSGTAAPAIQPADSRASFLSSFHNVLNLASKFFSVAMNTTMLPDAFPALSALRDLAVVLEESMHNQYGDLPAAARGEMLMQQFFFNRPEIQRFLGGRPNVTYQEPWMGQLDSLRTMMGWNDASVRHYRDLAVFGEQILLGVRTWPWTSENSDSVAAAWLQAWRPEIQGYIHSYRAVTGVDLSSNEVRVAPAEIATAQPSDLILRRRRALAATSSNGHSHN